jgi:hypothetical protein
MSNRQRPDSIQDTVTTSVQQATDWVSANRSRWVRGLLMLAFVVVFGALRFVVGLVALFQFGFLLFSGQPNIPLQRFGASLAFYAHDIVAYLTCVTERLPFPFTEWPRSANEEGS